MFFRKEFKMQNLTHIASTLNGKQSWAGVFTGLIVLLMLVLCPPSVAQQVPLSSQGNQGSQGKQTLQAADPAIYLMGEVHDNPTVHEARLKRLKQDIGTGWRPAIIMEQFDRERQEDLTRAWQTCVNAVCVIKQAGGKGWNWSLYEPLINLALQYRLPLIAGNVSRQDASKIMRGGYDAVFDAFTQKQLGLLRVWPDSMTAQQTQSIIDGHCGVLPQEIAMPMVLVQRARDAWLAHLVEQYALQGIVLIAGNGHVQRDLGVYRWLPPELLPNVTVMGFVEPGGVDFQAYDEVIVLPAFDRLDPCIVFKKMMRQSKPVAIPSKG